MPTETFKPQASCDDAFEHGDGYNYNWTDGDVVVQSYTDPGSQLYHCAGILFPEIPIPKGSVVTAAKFRGWIINLANDDANFKIYGNLVANPLDFCDLQSIISEVNRPRTTAYVEVIHDSWGTGWKEILGLEDVINEILTLAEWTSGNAIALLFIGNIDVGKGCMFASWDGSGVAQPWWPELEIKWSLPAYNPLINEPLVSPIIAGKPKVR